MPLTPGTRLGRYEVIRLIGAGGMGEVYLAKDSQLDRTVAIKVLTERLADNPELRQRFEREARAVSSLNHPHICTLYDVGCEKDVHYLVMEHLEGETLAARLKKGALPTEEALTCAIQIADALDKAHRQGVVHRPEAGKHHADQVGCQAARLRSGEADTGRPPVPLQCRAD